MSSSVMLVQDAVGQGSGGLAWPVLILFCSEDGHLDVLGPCGPIHPDKIGASHKADSDIVGTMTLDCGSGRELLAERCHAQ